jgi:N-methylhydantoinase A/oxoprolinase/acetone carboxylase beta subunit
MMIIGVDTGGTFTDFVFKEGDRWGVYKLLSTPSNPAKAVLEGLRHMPPMPFLRERVTSGCSTSMKEGHVRVNRLE